MTTFVHGRNLGKELCEALGLESRRIRSITIECSVDGPALVHVTEYVPDQPLERVLRSYRLVEAVDPEAES